MEQNKSKNWTICLNYIVFIINNTICQAINKTSYEIVFGMHPHNDKVWVEHLLGNENCFDEEELENIIIEQEDISHDFDKVSIIKNF